jgi:hypothetical protein
MEAHLELALSKQNQAFSMALRTQQSSLEMQSGTPRYEDLY